MTHTTIYAEDDLLPISALQHLLFCERQCALIHIERLWAENLFTAEGRIMHDRTDAPRTTTESGVRVARGMRVWSRQLGVFGICDVVEFREGVPTPVEYKRGRPKSHRADEVRLCAQAMCLEGMFDVRIPHADLFYGQPRRRLDVTLDEALRGLTRQVAAQCHALIDGGATPAAVYDRKRCSACSLLEICLPQRPSREVSVAEYVRQALADAHPTEAEPLRTGEKGP